VTDGLTIDTRQDGEVLVASLRGSLDERFDLLAWGRAHPNATIIDLSGVQFINSEGVGQWIRFLREAVRRGPIVLRRASEPMVSLFNMVTDAVDGAVVESIQTSYSCPRCNTEHLVDLEVTRDLADDRVMPERPCPTCGGSTSFDGLADRFLSFLGTE
jgi:anti-anti-sigma regulatory factor